MPISPPEEKLLARAPMALMDLYGRMRSLTDSIGCQATLPMVWQCSDESQGIKKALFGYVYDCPVFNLGRVGGLLDPTRLIPAAHHGHDLVILGGSHLGAREEEGIGYLERIHGGIAPCCGMLHRTLLPYLNLYQRTSSLVTIHRENGAFCVEIPYKYLFHKPPSDVPRIKLLLAELVGGPSLRDGNRGKIYPLHAGFADRHASFLASVGVTPVSIGAALDRNCFEFCRTLDFTAMDPRALLEVSVFDFLPDIVTSAAPHRRLADVNTWRQFHRIVSYLTDSFDSGDRNIFVVAGLTLDHTIRRNTFVPQFGFLMEQGRALQARYFGPVEIEELLTAQSIHRPTISFLDYAGA